jgi:hypothetical protein
MTAVAKGMADEVQELVMQSIKYGHELPANLKPIAQTMIDLGLLTDESGEKLDDLSDVKWATPIEKAVETLVDKMDELIQSLIGSGGVVDSFAKVGRTKVPPIVIPYEYRQQGPGIPGGDGEVAPVPPPINDQREDGFAGQAAGGFTQNITMDMDGQTVARVVARGLPRELKLQGVG